MAFETGALDVTLAAAAGDDAALYGELRAAFLDSLESQIDLLRRSRCDANWAMSALRLKALGASFQAGPLVALAEEALDAAPGDPVVLRKLREFHAQVAIR